VDAMFFLAVTTWQDGKNSFTLRLVARNSGNFGSSQQWCVMNIENAELLWCLRHCW